MKNLVLWFWVKSLRIKGELPAGANILGFWHQDLLAAFAATKSQKIALQISSSKDGSYASKLAQRFNFKISRGSSSSFSHSVRHLLKAPQDFSIAMAMDGPKGPAKKIKPGVFWLQNKRGRPLYQIKFQYQWSLKLKTWDYFRLPLPFSAVKLSFMDIDTKNDELPSRV